MQIGIAFDVGRKLSNGDAPIAAKSTQSFTCAETRKRARGICESQLKTEGKMDVQYWLAELDQYGNPTLIDGAHSDAQGANQAAYLITAMRLGKPNRRFAVARVELTECKPSAAGVNLEAVRTINNARKAGNLNDKENL